MKPGKHQRSKQGCQDLCCKVHNRAQSFVLRSYTMHELHNQNIWLVPRSVVNSYCVLCTVKAKKEKTKTLNKELGRVS